MVRAIRKKGTRNRPAGYLARTREQMMAAARMASQDPDPPVVPESELSTQADEPQPPANVQLQEQEQLPRNGEEVRQVEQASVDPAAVQAQYAHAMEAVVEAGQQEGGAVAYVDQQDQQPAEGAPHLEEASARDAAVPAGLAPSDVALAAADVDDDSGGNGNGDGGAVAAVADNAERGAPAGEEEAAPEETAVEDDSEEAVAAARVETLDLSKAVLELSASDDGHRTLWAGRVRGGAEVALDGGWVRKNFTSAFVRKVRGARGRFVHIDTSRPRGSLAAAEPGELGGADGAGLPPAPLPSIAYRQHKTHFCATYGPASAVHWYGDAQAAALVAAAACAALSSADPIGFVHDLVNAEAPGWQAQYLVKHNPLVVKFDEPVVLQLASSDGSDNHAVATVGDLIFDSAEHSALPLSRESLDRCAGLLTDGTKFSHVARAVRLLPGKSVKKQLRRSKALRAA